MIYPNEISTSSGIQNNICGVLDVDTLDVIWTPCRNGNWLYGYMLNKGPRTLCEHSWMCFSHHFKIGELFSLRSRCGLGRYTYNYYIIVIIIIIRTVNRQQNSGAFHGPYERFHWNDVVFHSKSLNHLATCWSTSWINGTGTTWQLRSRWYSGIRKSMTDGRNSR